MPTSAHSRKRILVADTVITQEKSAVLSVITADSTARRKGKKARDFRLETLAQGASATLHARVTGQVMEWWLSPLIVAVRRHR